MTPKGDLSGTAMSDCRGGARGVCLGRQSYSSPMECMGPGLLNSQFGHSSLVRD